MGTYNYEFQKFGCLFRQKGITVTTSDGHYISGEPKFVWWWPINWIVIAIGFPITVVIHLWNRRKP